MKERFTIIVEQGEDGYLIAEVVGLPGCRTQAKTHDELLKRAKAAILLHRSVQPKRRTKFLGLQQIEV